MLITNEDNMLLMSRYEDNYFDLAIVDPPYGIKRSKAKENKSINKSRKNGQTISRNHHKNKEWDETIPTAEYFKELFRVSINQVIWGGNYFTKHLYPVNSWIIWDKVDTMPTYSDGEMAWTNCSKPLKIVPLKHSGFRRGQNIGRDSKVIYNEPFSGKMDIHPTQKPVKLYEWLLMNYAKENDKILDTHLGSGSIAIACHNLGFDLTACELDKEYFDSAMKRIKEHQSQMRLFT